MIKIIARFAACWTLCAVLFGMGVFKSYAQSETTPNDSCTEIIADELWQCPVKSIIPKGQWAIIVPPLVVDENGNCAIVVDYDLDHWMALQWGSRTAGGCISVRSDLIERTRGGIKVIPMYPETKFRIQLELKQLEGSTCGQSNGSPTFRVNTDDLRLAREGHPGVCPR